MARRRKPENIPRDELLQAAEIAAVLGMTRQNVHPWLRRRAIAPVRADPNPARNPPTVNLYDRAEILAEAEVWKADARRSGDAKRKASALANAAK